MMGIPAKTDSAAVTKSALKVMIGGGLSLAAGLLSQVIIAAYFGAGADMDAFLLALIVPNYLLYVFVNGITFVVIPAFIQEETSGSSEDAWALIGTFFWVIIAVFSLIAVCVSLNARAILTVTGSNLAPEKLTLAARMLSIMALNLPFAGLNEFAVGVQNARGRFFWPAVATAAGSFGNIIVLLLLRQSFGSIALAWGSFASIVMTALIPLVPIIRHGWKKLIPLADPRIREILRLMVPIILLWSVNQSWTVFERFVATGLPVGSLSYIIYARKISGILVNMLAAGVASAVLPAMARAYAEKGEPGLAEQAENGFRLTFASALPAIFLFSAAAVPMVMLLYEHGMFQHTDTLHVSQILMIVLIGDLLFRMLNNINSRVFFVKKDTITYPVINALLILLYFVLAKTLAGRYGYVGLAVAYSIQNGIIFLITALLIKRRNPSFHFSRITKKFALYLAGGLIIFALVRWLYALVDFHSLVIQIAAALSIALAILFALLYWFDADLLLPVLGMIARKMNLKLPVFLSAPNEERQKPTHL